MSPPAPRSVVRACHPDGDASEVARIYNHYVRGSVATFEEVEVTPTEIRARMRAICETHPWLVREEGGQLVGFAYARPWHTRSAYRHTVETTIYLDPERTGQQLGAPLYSELLGRLVALGTRRAVAVIALPNDPSVRLHERLGFQKAGHLTEIGYKQGRWIDVGHWLWSAPGPGTGGGSFPRRLSGS